MSTTIYDLDIKGMREMMSSFHKTLYGRTIFFFAYFIPFALFIASAVMILIAGATAARELADIAIATFCASVVAFILGNIYFYSELRKFVESGKYKK